MEWPRVAQAVNVVHSHIVLFSDVWALILRLLSSSALVRSGCFTPLSFTTMSSSQYPVPPPSYLPSGSSRKPIAIPEDNVNSPLLGRSRSPGGGIYDQPQQGDLPDDFKVTLPRNYVLSVSSDTPPGSMASPSPRVLRKFEVHLFARFTPFYVRACLSFVVDFAHHATWFSLPDCTKCFALVSEHILTFISSSPHVLWLAESPSHSRL
jgi:hypothetical protein